MTMLDLTRTSLSNPSHSPISKGPYSEALSLEPRPGCASGIPRQIRELGLERPVTSQGLGHFRSCNQGNYLVLELVMTPFSLSNTTKRSAVYGVYINSDLIANFHQVFQLLSTRQH